MAMRRERTVNIMTFTPGSPHEVVMICFLPTGGHGAGGGDTCRVENGAAKPADDGSAMIINAPQPETHLHIRMHAARDSQKFEVFRASARS